MFTDREDAGRQLAANLADLAGQDVVVLGIPRGGVEVAAVVAAALGAPLDVVIPRKVGAPANPELGIGAVAEDVEVLDERLIRLLGVSEDYLRQEIEAQQEEIRRRSAACTAHFSRCARRVPAGPRVGPFHGRPSNRGRGLPTPRIGPRIRRGPDDN